MATWGVDGGVREGERTRLLAVNVHIPVFPGRTAKPCLRRREVQEEVAAPVSAEEHP